jgi:hypothetical protein
MIDLLFKTPLPNRAISIQFNNDDSCTFIPLLRDYFNTLNCPLFLQKNKHCYDEVYAAASRLEVGVLFYLISYYI